MFVSLELARAFPEKYKIYQLTCKQCGAEFESTNPRARYCGGRCKLKMSRNPPCLKCGRRPFKGAHPYYLIEGIKDSKIHLCPDCRKGLKEGKWRLFNLLGDYKIYPMATRILDAIRYGSYDVLGNRYGVDIPYNWACTLKEDPEGDHTV